MPAAQHVLVDLCASGIDHFQRQRRMITLDA
jgi:hypothetical protein